MIGHVVMHERTVLFPFDVSYVRRECQDITIRSHQLLSPSLGALQTYPVATCALPSRQVLLVALLTPFSWPSCALKSPICSTPNVSLGLVLVR